VDDDSPHLLTHRGAPDARSLSPQARAELRREVILAVRGGMTRLEAARRFGVSRRTVGSWMQAYRTTGSEIIQERARGRPPAAQAILTLDQELAVLRLMRAAHPVSLGLDGHLWTHRTVTDLIGIHTGHLLETGAVDHYLRRWQLTSKARTLTEHRIARLSCHPITLPGTRTRDRTSPAGEIWTALVVETGRGVHLRLPRGCVDRDTLHAFGRHLIQHSTRPVHLLVWRWPDSLREVLHAWQADPGPGLVLGIGWRTG
jgi:transposase